jgi:OmpA-OmpF porin, OOP family
MMNSCQKTLKVAAALVMAVLPLLAAAQTLNPAGQRITDQAIHADYQTYEQTQLRIKAINDTGRPVRDYHLAKAQCWLDVSFHEYTRNDRSAFPQQALDQSARLLVLMEQKASALPMDTPLVNDAEKLRPDLWQAAERLKAHEGFQCIASPLACAEVELVHAGNEMKQQGWRHAKPYVQIAEDQLLQAEKDVEACVVKPLAKVVAKAVEPAPAVPVVKPRQAFEMQANVLFNHDRYQRNQARPLTLDRLDNAVARSRENGVRLAQIQLVGHADRTGAASYNQALAERRVQTVKQYLMDAGLDAALIQTSVKGDSQQVSVCQGKFKSRTEELECLLPNRRVEVNFIGER